MVKRACVDENGIRKGEWSPEEDNLLKVHIQKNGYKNWRLLPERAGLARCGKSCRLRYVNYLKPGILNGGFTKDEVELITKLYQQMGPKWSAMAKMLPGRTDNDIKNHWHAHIKKHTNKKKNKSPVVEHTSDGFSLTATSTVVDDDGDSCVEKKPHQDSSAAGSSTITSLDNAILACDHDVADSWDSLIRNDQLITSMDGLYLADHIVEMGNNQQYYCNNPTPSYISQDDFFQPLLLPKTGFSSSNSLSSLEWMSNGDGSSSDSQAAQSVFLQQESFLMNEPATATFNFSNKIGYNNYQWGDFGSSFAGQAQLDEGDFNNCYNLWDLDNGSRC